MIRRPIEPLAWSVAGLFVLLLAASTLVLASFLASALADDWPGPLRMAQLDGHATCLEIRSRAPEGAWVRISGRPDAWFLPTATLDASHPAGAWATLQLRDGRWFCAPQLSVLDQGRPVTLGFSELRDWMNSMAADRDRLRRQARDGQESSAQEYRRLAAAESSLRLRLDGTGQDVSFSDVATLHPPAASFTARLGIFLANLHGHLRSPSGFPAALVGTALTTLLAALLASPLGIAAAIWLSEFSRPGLFARLFRRSVQLLSGIPPVVFGAFGLVFLVRGIVMVFCGITYPVSLLPGWMQSVTTWLPQTYIIHAVRSAALTADGLQAILPDLKALALFGAFWLATGYYLFNWMERRARQTGAIGQY